MNESHPAVGGPMLAHGTLIHTIKAHIARSDKAKDKAKQHYIAAGQHLKTLKASHGGSWAEWEELLKTKIGIGKSRASELMRIADGTKTIEQVRADTPRLNGGKTSAHNGTSRRLQKKHFRAILRRRDRRRPRHHGCRS